MKHHAHPVMTGLCGVITTARPARGCLPADLAASELDSVIMAVGRCSIDWAACAERTAQHVLRRVAESTGKWATWANPGASLGCARVWTRGDCSNA